MLFIRFYDMIIVIYLTSVHRIRFNNNRGKDLVRYRHELSTCNGYGRVINLVNN